MWFDLVLKWVLRNVGKYCIGGVWFPIPFCHLKCYYSKTIINPLPSQQSVKPFKGFRSILIEIVLMNLRKQLLYESINNSQMLILFKLTT